MKNRIALILFFLIPTLFAKAAITLDDIAHISTSCSSGSNTYTTGEIYITSSLSGASYNWSGPGGFSSTSQDLVGLTTTGQYTVTASVRTVFGTFSESATISLGYYTDYSYFTGTNEVTVNNRPALQNTSGQNSWCRGAYSKNILPAGYNGWAEYKATVTNTHRLIGFTGYLGSSHCWGYMNYGVYLKDNGDLIQVISGAQTLIGTYAVNDLIRVAREGTNFVIYKNNTAISTYAIGTTGQNKDLLFEASIWSAGGLLENIGLSFKPPMDVQIDVVNIPKGTSIGGSITLTPCGTGYSYQWSNGATTSSISNLAVGSYDVTITDGNGWMVKKEISIGYDISWANRANATVSGNILTKTGGTADSWDAGANSDVFLAANTDGWVEYEVVETNKERAFGFSTSPVSTHPLTSINYGIDILSNGTASRTLSGTVSPTFGNIKKGDIIRIERVGTTISFYENGFLMSPTTVLASENLYVEASFYTLSGMFENVRGSVNDALLAQYYSLNSKLDGGYVIVPTNDDLRILYNEEYQDADGQLNYQIFAAGTTTPLATSVKYISFGINYLKIGTSSFSAGFYILEVTNDKNEKKYLRFKIS